MCVEDPQNFLVLLGLEERGLISKRAAGKGLCSFHMSQRREAWRLVNTYSHLLTDRKLSYGHFDNGLIRLKGLVPRHSFGSTAEVILMGLEGEGHAWEY